MTLPFPTKIHFSNSSPRFSHSDPASIEVNSELRDLTILLPNQSQDISHLALDIGGSLIKLVYFSRTNEKSYFKESLEILNGDKCFHVLGGRLHFVKFETREIQECLDFIYSNHLHCVGTDPQGWISQAKVDEKATIKATGGGAYKFANMFKERLDVNIEKEDEMSCLVAGANFVLKGIEQEAFTHNESHMKFVHIDQNDLFPYLLVNIGSGVSVIKVDGDGKYERVGGTNIGGGTFCGLGRLLTKGKSFDELLEASQGGDNEEVDMLVGDIYGDRDYTKIGLSASTIASSFGKVFSESKNLDDYRPEDISLSLLRMISYHIGQLAHSKACEYGLKRIFFGGFFIRGHAYTMDTISHAVQYWSKGNIEAMFLRHEGFLGVIGALMSNETLVLHDLKTQQFVDNGPSRGDSNDKVTEGKPKPSVYLELQCKNENLKHRFEELREKHQDLEKVIVELKFEKEEREREKKRKLRELERSKWAIIFLVIVILFSWLHRLVLWVLQ